MLDFRTLPVIIGFKKKPSKSHIDYIVNQGGVIKRVFHIINAISTVIPEKSITIIKKQSEIDYLETDEKLFAHIPLTTYKEVQTLKQTVPWNIERVGSRIVNALGNTGKGIKVGILDTGADYNHEDLSKNCKKGYNYVENNDKPLDDNMHGSHVAGIIGAEDNDIGVVGIAPDAELYPIKVLDYASTGTASDLVAGLEWSLDNKMDVINMSLGSSLDSKSVKNACDALYNSGTLLIAAAGNSGNKDGTGNNVDDPAKYDSVIAVAATDDKDRRAYFSSTGPKIEIAAPGVGICSTLPGNKYGILSGTSMASPIVTGVAALIKNNDPKMTNLQIRIRLQVSAQNISKGISASNSKNWFGYGLVDAPRAVSF